MAEKSQKDHSPTRSNSEPRLPHGHFNADGQSQGKHTGPVRSTPDAYNHQRQNDKREER